MLTASAASVWRDGPQLALYHWGDPLRLRMVATLTSPLSLKWYLLGESWLLSAKPVQFALRLECLNWMLKGLLALHLLAAKPWLAFWLMAHFLPKGLRPRARHGGRASWRWKLVSKWLLASFLLAYVVARCLSDAQARSRLGWCYHISWSVNCDLCCSDQKRLHNLYLYPRY